MQSKCYMCKVNIVSKDLHGIWVCEDCFNAHSKAVGLIKIHWEADGNGKNNNNLSGRQRAIWRAIKPRIS